MTITILETTPLTLADILGIYQWQGLFPFMGRQQTNPLAPGKITDLMDLISSWGDEMKGQLGKADLFSRKGGAVLHVCCVGKKTSFKVGYLQNHGRFYKELFKSEGSGLYHVPSKIIKHLTNDKWLGLAVQRITPNWGLFI